MRKAAVARRFAKALLDVTIEENSAERCQEELENLLEVFRHNPELYKVLHTPLHTALERISLMNKVSEAAEVSEAVAGFMKVLVQTRNIKLFEEIVVVYPRLFDIVAGRLRAAVESPWELGTDVVEDLVGLTDAERREVVADNADGVLMMLGILRAGDWRTDR